MMPFSVRVHPNSPGFEDELARCTRDRNLVLEQFQERYPEAGRLLPAQIVRDVLRDVCGYGIQERRLPRGQAALCDFGIKRIKLNTYAKLFHNLAWIRALLAHELGHVRLHSDEMDEQTYISSVGGFSEGFDDPRFFIKEHEADLYAAVFTVPIELLEKSKVAMARREELEHADREPSSQEMWGFVDELAGVFQTTRDLMRYALEAYGWLSFAPARKFSRAGKLTLLK